MLCRGVSNNGDIRLFYDLKLLCWIINSFKDIAIKTAIIDIIYNQLQLQIVTDKNPTAECFLEYLPIYKGLLIAASTYTPAVSQQKQEQIYSIPTNLTEELLRRILRSLKTEEFVASEQTEEDFLNSFEIEGRKPTKQGKIYWIKKSGKSKKDSKQIIPRTVILDFIKLVGKGLFVENKERIIEAVFSIQVRPEEFTRAKSDNYKSEYNTELQQIITE